MKVTQVLLLAVLACSVTPLVLKAEEKAPKQEAPKEETFKGHLAAPTGQGQGTLKEDAADRTTASKSYVLWAEGDVAKELADLIKARAHVEVTGAKAADGVNIKVSKLVDLKDEKKGNKKK